MCADDEATEENLKKVGQFVDWFKELTGKDMEYSVRAKTITLHNDEFIDESEDSYECNCEMDSDESSEEDCKSCRENHKEEKKFKLFLKVVRDIIEIPSTNNSFDIHSIDWKKVEQLCNIEFIERELKCTNKKNGKGISFEFFCYSLHCHRFTYFIGSFCDTCYFDEPITMITWMDSFVEGIFKHDYSLFVSYVLFYVEQYLSSHEEVSFLEDQFMVGVLKCTPNSITMSGCHFIYTFYKIDEVAFHSLYKDVYGVYKKVGEEKIQNMVKSVEMDQEKLLKIQQENKKELETFSKKVACSADRITEKRRAMEVVQNNVKRIKLLKD